MRRLVNYAPRNDALDCGSPLDARSAHEQPDLRAVEADVDQHAQVVERSTPCSSASLGIFFTCSAARRTGITCLLPSGVGCAFVVASRHALSYTKDDRTAPPSSDGLFEVMQLINSFPLGALPCPWESLSSELETRANAG